MPNYSSLSGETKLSNQFTFDPQEKRFYSLKYRPDTWSAHKETVQGVDVVIPSPPNGCKYEAVSGGATGAISPVFLTTKKGVTIDNDVSWRCLPYDLELLTGDLITASTFVGTNNETLDNEAIIDGVITKFRLTGVSDGATSVTIVNHITVVRLNGDEEEFDNSIVIPVASL